MCRRHRWPDSVLRAALRRGAPALVGAVAVASVGTARAQPAADANAVPAAEPGPGAPVAGAPAAPGAIAPEAAPPAAVASPEVVALRAEVEALRATAAEQQRRLDELAAKAEAAAEPPPLTAEPVVAEAPSLRLYGFMDVGFRRYFTGDDNRLVAVWMPAATAVLGNVNLYLDGRPHPNVRTLAEVRFSQYPHYAMTTSSLDGESTAVYDVNSSTGGNEVIWSGIVLERAQIEWTRFDLFNVRVGYFLTPFGIWNVDHSMAVLITQRLPQFFSREYYPTRQTGLEISGLEPFGDFEFEYHAWVGNGRTHGTDATDDKMFGGRIVGGYDGAVRVALGASGFYGRNAFARHPITSFAPFTTDIVIDTEYDEYGGGLDLSLDWEGLRFRWEGVVAREEYLEGSRAEFAPGYFRPDRTRSGTYAVLAYRLPWGGLEPYLWVERDVAVSNAPSTIPSAGINVHLSPSVQIKGNFGWVVFDEPDEDLDFSVLDLRLVAVF